MTSLCSFPQPLVNILGAAAFLEQEKPAIPSPSVASAVVTLQGTTCVTRVPWRDTMTTVEPSGEEGLGQGAAREAKWSREVTVGCRASKNPLCRTVLVYKHETRRCQAEFAHKVNKFGVFRKGGGGDSDQREWKKLLLRLYSNV